MSKLAVVRSGPTYYPRGIEPAIARASRQFPVLLLTGARQVGKTTVLRQLARKGRTYVTLDDPSLRELAGRDPALFLQRFPCPVLIDEIQYAPQLLPYIKMAVDEARRPGAFWLTGSQQFALMRHVTETLAGRVAMVELHGFSVRERDRRPLRLRPFLPTPRCIAERSRSPGASSPQSVYREIWKGSFPAVLAGPGQDRDLFFRSYIQTYLERDLRDLAAVGDRAAFLRFMRAAAARSACLLNLSDLARDVDVSVKTAKAWLSILEASYQVALLPPYHTNLSKRLVKAPKLYFLDTGLCSYLTEWSSPETLAAGAMAGAIFETHVYAEILKSWCGQARRPGLWYYRDRDGREIDFLFEQDGKLHPLEVKKGATPRMEWARMGSLERLGRSVGQGAVVCLAPAPLPITKAVTAVPVGII